MSEYTPNTHEVRETWINSQDMTWDRGGEFHEAEFDRWLASVKAEAWDEGAAALDSGWNQEWPSNPYRED